MLMTVLPAGAWGPAPTFRAADASPPRAYAAPVDECRAPSALASDWWLDLRVKACMSSLQRCSMTPRYCIMLVSVTPVLPNVSLRALLSQPILPNMLWMPCSKCATVRVDFWALRSYLRGRGSVRKQ